MNHVGIKEILAKLANVLAELTEISEDGGHRRIMEKLACIEEKVEHSIQHLHCLTIAVGLVAAEVKKLVDAMPKVVGIEVEPGTPVVRP